MTTMFEYLIRRGEIRRLGFVLLGWLLLFSLPAPELRAENILLFTIDSCRADRFGTYGYPGETTPEIDKWARSGTVFTRAYSTSAWTAPGLVSILSGLHPPTHGVNSRDRTGSPELTTLIKSFKDAGYEVPNLNFFTFAPYYQHLGLGPVDRQYLKSEEPETLMAWLEEKAHLDRERPFFVWFHTTLVHQPYRPKDEDLPAAREELEKSPGIKAVLNGAIVPVGSTTFQEGDQAVLDQLYNAEMKRTDEAFGRAMDLLKDRGLLDSTLVILTADHGEELLDHGFVGHASTSLQAKLYEEFVHIPLMISWPGRVPAGEVIHHPVSQIDIAPTVYDLISLPPPKGLQGRHLLEGGGGRDLFFESVIAGNQTPQEREDEWVRAVLSGRYKYVSNGELFDLLLDPGEKDNLATEHPQLVRSMRDKLAHWLEASRDRAQELFPREPGRYRSPDSEECPRIYTPGNGETLNYDVHTGALLFDWRGDMETAYLIQYDIGEGDRKVEGMYEVEGNHQILGPFPRELWRDLKGFNPFRIRVSPRTEPRCWSEWTEFYF